MAENGLLSHVRPVTGESRARVGRWAIGLLHKKAPPTPLFRLPPSSLVNTKASEILKRDSSEQKPRNIFLVKSDIIRGPSITGRHSIPSTRKFKLTLLDLGAC